MTLFLNPAQDSYARLGKDKAPLYISWAEENRSQLLRIPAAAGQYRRVELRSPDSAANPYLVFALLIHAALDGLERGTELPEPARLDLLNAEPETLKEFRRLPVSLEEAAKAARDSDFIRVHVPEMILNAFDPAKR